MRLKGICAGLAVGIAAGLALSAVRVQGAEEYSELLAREFLRPLIWLVQQIEDYYVEDVRRETLLEGAYQGMVQQADPGGVYLPAAMTDRYGPRADETIPELGLNTHFLPLQKAVAIDGTIPGGPAFGAGLLTGDFILDIRQYTDEEAAETEDFDSCLDVVSALHGEPGTRVVLTVVRPGAGLEREVELTRASDQGASVQATEMLDEEAGIGYLALTHFDERTVGQLFTALSRLERRGARGAILDMRFNPGGALDSALMCADLLLDEGVLMGARSRDGKEITQEAERGDAFPDMRIVLLVNNRTADAAEVMVAALADNGRAGLAGQRTLGRGSLRTTFDCPHDGSTIRLAVARYLRPNGKEIENDELEESGLAPDV